MSEAAVRRRQQGADRADFERSRTREPLSTDERTTIVTEIARLVEQLYVHLPLKRAMYGIDPVQQLRRLADRATAERMDDAQFHEEIARIVAGLRDAHTVYFGPSAVEGVVARLPFLVEQYGPDDDPGFIVSKVVGGAGLVDDPSFDEGAELLDWNGVPMLDAVRRHALDERGGRPDSALARAVDTMTFRPIGYVPVPPEHWVIVGFRPAGGGERREVRLHWRFVSPGAGPDHRSPTEASAMQLAIHPDRALVRRAKKLSFASGLWASEDLDRAERELPDRVGDDPVAGRFQDAVSAQVVTVDGVDYGLLRLWSFDLADDEAYVREVIDLLALLPQTGLIVDLRGNPGGLIIAAERLLQLFTPGHVEPTRFSLVASDLTRRMTDAPQNRRLLGAWRRSLFEARATGELYSQGVPITPVERCNDIGQVYGGPVVAVVDATTYSAGDLFAAGFADNSVGTVVSIGSATGAGGANVWSSDVVQAVLSGSGHDLDPLPGGAGFTISVRRATRIGASEGAPIEDVGVVGHRVHAMTRRDLLESNVDLIAFCARLIDAQPATSMRVEPDSGALEVTTTGVDRLDVYVDGRPRTSLATDGAIRLPVEPSADEVRIEGYRGDVHVQTRRIPV